MHIPSVSIDSDASLSTHFLPYQVNWIRAEDHLHASRKQAFALAEKSVRIGWTYADAFKNVRKRLRYPKRDYLFATKDYPSALEYMRQAYAFAELFNLTRSIVSHGEESLEIPRLDNRGRSTAFTDELKVGVIKFDNGSRIIAFSSHPQAMAVYGGDVGLDEFAKHPRAELLWQTAQARITWGFDIAVWSSHEGDDTLFYQFAQEARAGKGPWNLYYHVTMPDALALGLLDVINRERNTAFSAEQFLADCRSRSRLDEVYQQSYLCNPLPGAAQIVDWSAIERCRADYAIDRVHLEAPDVLRLFGEFSPGTAPSREEEIASFMRSSFPSLFSAHPRPSSRQFRLGFDVAASGQGDLAAIYIDEAAGGSDLWLRGLFTCRTDDWHFLKSVLFTFLHDLRNVEAAGDESGLGRQICWEAASRFPSRFTSVNFAAKKHDLGFTLMNQLSVAEKRFPQDEPDIAADYFALRKAFTGKKWIFTESRNTWNAASHCDIAWAGALASHAHLTRRVDAWALVG